MATQTGSLDLKAVKQANDSAAKIATSYIVDTDGGGMFVHRADENYTTPTAANAYGVHISDDVNIVRGGKVVASYGEEIILGENNGDTAQARFGNTGIKFIDKDGQVVGLIQSAGATITGTLNATKQLPYINTTGTTSSQTYSFEIDNLISPICSTQNYSTISVRFNKMHVSDGMPWYVGWPYVYGDSTNYSYDFTITLNLTADGVSTSTNTTLAVLEYQNTQQTPQNYTQVGTVRLTVSAVMDITNSKVTVSIGIVPVSGESHLNVYGVITDINANLNYISGITYAPEYLFGTRRAGDSKPFAFQAGEQVLVGYNNQTSFGKYNSPENDDAFEIGNGTENANSNAFAVTWNGDIKLALNTSASSGTDYDLNSAITALGWGSAVII